MNKPAMNAIRKQAQSGFTLIELIVVIVILGILAATALPKFSSVSADARVASLKAVQGGLQSTIAMAHGQWLINQNSVSTTTLTYEGTSFTVATTGYPTATAAFAQAAGANTNDYSVIAASHTGDANSPTTGADEIAIIPLAYVGSTKGATCYLKYKEATSATVPPVLTLSASTTNC